MKRKFLLILCLILCMAAAAFADTPFVTKNSGVKTASALIYTGRVKLFQVIITTDGTNNAAVDLYDNTAGTGTKICPTITVTGTDYFAVIPFPGFMCTTGIYLAISGTGASAVVYYWP